MNLLGKLLKLSSKAGLFKKKGLRVVVVEGSFDSVTIVGTVKLGVIKVGCRQVVNWTFLRDSAYYKPELVSYSRLMREDSRLQGLFLLP